MKSVLPSINNESPLRYRYMLIVTGYLYDSVIMNLKIYQMDAFLSSLRFQTSFYRF